MNNEHVQQVDLDDDEISIPGIPAGSKNYMTPQGHLRMQQALRKLVGEARPEVVKIINWAASNGDRSENGDYIYGKRRLREIDRQIRFYTKRLENAEVVDPSLRDTDQIFFGATVTVLREDGEAQTFSIVGLDEMEPSKGYISWVSPIARTLTKARAGDVVRLKTPQGVEEIEVLAVVYKTLD